MDKALFVKAKFIRAFAIIVLGSGVLCFYLLKTKPSESEEVSILFTGDILLSRNVEVEIKSRNQHPWIHLEHIFHSADLLIGNLEGSVGDSLIEAGSKNRSPQFLIKPKSIQMVRNAGFDGLITENNHSSDLLKAGINRTQIEIQNLGLKPVNFQNSPLFFAAKGKTISLIAINLIPGKDTSIQKIPSIEILQKIRTARCLSNLVVVYIHWGNELNTWPNNSQIIAANWLTKHGVDLIIGSHPHVIQAPSNFNEKIVFYSLGNHLFDQKYELTKIGLIADCKIQNDELECRGLITKTANNSFFPVLISDTNYNLKKVKLAKPIEIGGVALNVDTKNKFVSDGLVLNGTTEKNKLLWKTSLLNIKSLEPITISGHGKCLFAIQKHYSPLDKTEGLRPYVYAYTKSGLRSLWRGSALAFPLLDACMLPSSPNILCALHRGDSFLVPDPKISKTKILAYTWNGFGFKGVNDSTKCKECKEYFDELYNSK